VSGPDVAIFAQGPRAAEGAFTGSPFTTRREEKPLEDLSVFLATTPTIETAHPEVVAFARRHTAPSGDPVETAVKLYYAVRDGFRYDPYLFSLTVDGLKASQTLGVGRGWCVPKAILLAAACRAVGIPARLGYADVRNHLSTARLRERMQTDVFHWHGYTALHLEGRWVKATPAFNVELCEKFGLLPLEFDGKEDSLFHPFDSVGNRHMEYLRYRGEFADIPIDAILATFREIYPGRRFVDDAPMGEDADFDRDVEAETVAG
jgi:transglutaminase-like putative cysteine protease